MYCPEVVVLWGEESGEEALILEPWWVAVVASALRLSGEREIRAKIEQVLHVMGSRGHRTVVLGAWGCGAFGNETAVVARQMAEAIMSCGAAWGLERVIFAVPDPSKAEVFRAAVSGGGDKKERGKEK